jgi:hypothetical protein
MRWAIWLAFGAVGFFAVPLGVAAAGAPAGVPVSPTALSGWSSLAPFDFGGSGSQHELRSVSCPSAALCVGVDSNGDAVTSTNPIAATPSWSINHVYDGYGLNGISCPSTSLCVAVGGLPGNVSITTDPTDGASATWTSTNVDGSASMYQISCPSTALCAAIDAGNVVISSDPTDPSPTWKVVNIEHSSDPNAGTLAGISCPTTTLCAAVDESGRVLTSEDPTDGSFATWNVTNLVPSSDGLSSISCPSESLCVALDRQGDAITSTNPTRNDFATWTFANIDAITNHAGAISCASATLCVAGDAAGNILASKDPGGGASKWTVVNADPPNRVYGIGSPNAIAAISCDPTSSFCVAVDANGHAVTSTNPTGAASAWSVTQADTDVEFQSNAPTAVSCASDTFCAAVDARGNILATTDPADGAATAWTPSPQVVPQDVFRAISCPSQSFCVAVDWVGNVAASTDPAASTPTWSVTPSSVDSGGGFHSISCPSTSLCVAAADFGTVVTSKTPADPASWKLKDVDGNTDILGVSCPSASFCVAVDGVGDVLTSKDPSDGANATWTVTAHSVADGNNLVAVSCPSALFCAAVDGNNHVIVSTDPLGGTSAWTAVAIGSDAYPGTYLGSISCASASLCVATGTAYGRMSGERFASADPAGGASAWVGGNVDSNDDLDGVSCPSNGMCLVVAESGSFTSAVAPQSATTDTAGSVTDTTATLQGTVDPNGWAVSDCRFDYGTSSAALNSTVPCAVSLPIPGTSSNVAVSAAVTALQPSTTYYFQLVTTSTVGTRSGKVQDFTSAQAAMAAPVLSSFSIAPSTFVAARRHGAHIAYHDTQAAVTRFTVQRKVTGVSQAGKCVAPRQRTATHRLKRCIFWRGVGSFARQDVAGANRFHFVGRVKHRTLVPGRYRLRVIASLHGLTSNRMQASFRVRTS